MTQAPPKKFPDCWGHRGASARFPENTLASFEAAIRDGAEGIESDVHISADDVVIMFHDPTLKRTTDGTGLIRERVWFGEDGMEHLRTKKEPKQAIPTFEQTIALLMKPENRHVKLNIDVKVQNDPARLFPLMHAIISSYDDWETLLASRLVLGLWHPRFLYYAKSIIPYCRRSYIGMSPEIARKYFWDDCDAFSMLFEVMTTPLGEAFRKECQSAGKLLMVWTVNDPRCMMEAVRWRVDVILTDRTNTWLEMRSALEDDYEKMNALYANRIFLWTWPFYYSTVLAFFKYLMRNRLESAVGYSFDDDPADTVPAPPSPPPVASAAAARA